MGEDTSLSSGRQLELEVFGLTVEGDFLSARGELLPFDWCLQLVIQENWVKFSDDQENGSLYIHNPAKPEMGRTGEMWSTVLAHLPEIDGKFSPLNLYVALGHYLDYHYGIDAFFWWQGVYVSLDVSRRNKKKEAEKPKMELKADFLFTPYCLTKDGMERFGKLVANKLIFRKEHVEDKKQRINRAHWI